MIPLSKFSPEQSSGLQKEYNVRRSEKILPSTSTETGIVFVLISDFLFLDASEQLVGYARIIEPHNALSRTTEIQEVDASVPDNILIEDGKFLMDIRFIHHLDASCPE